MIDQQRRRAQEQLWGRQQWGMRWRRRRTCMFSWYLGGSASKKLYTHDAPGELSCARRGGSRGHSRHTLGRVSSCPGASVRGACAPGAHVGNLGVEVDDRVGVVHDVIELRVEPPTCRGRATWSRMGVRENKSAARLAATKRACARPTGQKQSAPDGPGPAAGERRLAVRPRAHRLKRSRSSVANLGIFKPRARTILAPLRSRPASREAVRPAAQERGSPRRRSPRKNVGTRLHSPEAGVAAAHLGAPRSRTRPGRRTSPRLSRG